MTYVTGHCEVVPFHRPSPQSDVPQFMCRQTAPWMWASGHSGHIERAAHGYEPTRESAMAAFAKSWRRYNPTAPLAQRCAT